MSRLVLIIGLFTLAAAWLGPLPALASEAFFAHMALHMAVVAVAAPLLALALAQSRFDPRQKAPRLLAPIPASLVELVVVWGWHVPALHHAARHHAPAFVAEQGTFLLAGILLWLSSIGGQGVAGAQRTAAGVIALLFTAMHMTLLGVLMALGPRPLYTHMEGFAGLSALDDQQLGGAIMILVGGVSYLTGGLWLTMRLLRGPRRASLERTCPD